MITAIIRNKENTLVLELPHSIYDIYEKLQSIGIMQPPKQIPLTDNEDEDIGVKLFSESDFGQHLLLTLNEKNTIADANISVFQNGSLTNILFPFEDGVEIDMGKLAMWRLRSHEQFGGTWLSDYVPNRLGGFITEHEPDKIKPDCRLIGEDGNIFNLMGLAARTLRHNGLAEQATEMTGRIHECGSYDEALCITPSASHILTEIFLLKTLMKPCAC